MVLIQDTIVMSTSVAGVFKLAVGVWALRVASVIPVQANGTFGGLGSLGGS